MMNAAAGIFLAARRKPRLPYDAEVEYLESTGKQWINTGVYIRLSDIVKVDVLFANRNSFFGAYDTTQPMYFNITGTADVSYAYYGKTVGTLGRSNTTVGTRYTFELGDGHLSINGTVVGTRAYTDDVSQLSLYMFSRNRNGVANDNLVGNIYSFTIVRSGVEIMHLIPVRFTNEQGVSEGAMYDRSGTGGMNPDGSARTDGLYRNRGTDAFLWAEKSA